MATPPPQPQDEDLFNMFNSPTPPPRARARSASLVQFSDNNDGEAVAADAENEAEEGRVAKRARFGGGQAEEPLFAPPTPERPVARPGQGPGQGQTTSTIAGRAGPSTATATANGQQGRAKPRLASRYNAPLLPRHNNQQHEENPFAPDDEDDMDPETALAMFDDLDFPEVAAPDPAAAAAGQQRPNLGLPLLNGGEGDFDPLAMGGASLPFGGPGGTGATGEDGEKKRRVMPKMDSERFLSDKGLPLLVKEVRKFKIKGKGYETQDLSSLMSLYQLWAHQMFPKSNFKDTVGRIEKVCRQRDVQYAMKKIKAEKKRDVERKLRRLRGEMTATPDPEAIRTFGQGEEEDAVLGEENGQPRNQNQNQDQDQDQDREFPREDDLEMDFVAPPTAGNSSRQRRVIVEEEEEEDFDLDGMIAAAEAEAEALQAQDLAGGDGQKEKEMEMEVDGEAEVEVEGQKESAVAAATLAGEAEPEPLFDFGEEEEGWAAMEE